jgi:GTPase
MENIIAVGATFVLGISVVGVFVGKYIGKLVKGITLAKEALDVVEAVIKAIEDKNMSEAEVKNVIVQAKEAKAAFTAFMVK